MKRDVDRQCHSCGGFCKPSGCERAHVDFHPEQDKDRVIAESLSEARVLVGLLIAADKVLETIEPESDDEAESLSGLRMAIGYAVDPYSKREGTLL